jgi:transcriptional regulator with XRE-family HTH domain
VARSTLLKIIARISTMPRSRSTVKQARVQPVTAKSPTDIDREGGKRLRALREEAGMSQTALAERAGITFQQVQKYENGANRVSISRLIQFCEALDVPPSQVLDGLSTARQPKADPLQPLRTERGVRLAKAWDRLDPKKQVAILNLIEETAGR